MLLIVQTSRHRYAVRHDDLSEIRLIDGRYDAVSGEYDQRLIRVDLGAFFDAEDRSSLRRRRALVVPLRRKQIALMVDSVESFEQHVQVGPLPALLQARLVEPWAVGTLVVDDQVVVQLDLRAVARSVLLSRPTKS